MGLIIYFEVANQFNIIIRKGFGVMQWNWAQHIPSSERTEFDQKAGT